MTNLQIILQKPGDLLPYQQNARTHDKKQIKQIAKSIKEFGFNVPILIDKDSQIIAGHGRVLAAEHLSLAEVPTILLDHLTEAQKRAFIIADNKLTENAGWDMEMLSLEFSELADLDLSFDLDITGFSVGEIDVIINPVNVDEKADEIPDVDETKIITQSNDIWLLGEHRVICGDSIMASTYDDLLEDKKAQMIVTDPPYNVKIDGNVCGKGKIKHEEFAMASGEMSKSEFTSFLDKAFQQLIQYSDNGSIHFVFMDWRHMQEMLEAGNENYDELKNLCIWNKTNAGMGTFYRSKHELVFVFKNGDKPHINNFELGQNGRYRTNVWDYAGANVLSAGDSAEDTNLDWHPTVKPVQMLADAIMDCSNHNNIVLDPFLGSGSTLIAAEKTKRICYGIELEPKYIDIAIRRWQEYTGQDAINLANNQTFNEIEDEK